MPGKLVEALTKQMPVTKPKADLQNELSQSSSTAEKKSRAVEVISNHQKQITQPQTESLGALIERILRTILG